MLWPQTLCAQSEDAGPRLTLKWVKESAAHDAVFLSDGRIALVTGNPSRQRVYRILDRDGGELFERTDFEPPMTVSSRPFSVGPRGLVAADPAWSDDGCPAPEVHVGWRCARLFAAYDLDGELETTGYFVALSPEADLNVSQVTLADDTAPFIRRTTVRRARV